MEELSEETEVTQETSASPSISAWSTARAFVVFRVRSLAQQSKVGVWIGFSVLFLAAVLFFGSLISLLPVALWLKMVVGIFVLTPVAYGAYGVLEDAEVV